MVRMDRRRFSFRCLSLVLFLMTLPGGTALVKAAEQGQRLRWDHRESVRYQENHDPSMIWLTDGRKLQVHYGKLTWKQVEQWKKGRALTLRYTVAEGLQLVDDATGGRLRVLGGMPHPLDGLLDRNLERAESTMGMAECYSQASRQWELEMNRNLKELRAALPREESLAVQAAQEAWLKFRDQERKAINAINNREGTGTITILNAGGAHLRVTRDRALHLESQLAEVL
ncbi:MAG: hypothetical protein RJA22_2533 [Verrucomicrobiota bacterium]|jgi:uncharacterized protein YecT (DUF1311 family)